MTHGRPQPWVVVSAATVRAHAKTAINAITGTRQTAQRRGRFKVEIRLPNNWKPRPYQLPAWTYLERGGRHAELLWHRRSGKDEVALHWTACAAFERPANYWHMLPEASQARKAIWNAVNPHTGMRRIDEAFPKELRAATRDQEMLIRFVNGSTWQVLGSDNFDSLVGSPPVGIVYSEWALANPAARSYLRPILAENGGWQLFITTPRGRNHAARTFLAAQKEPGAFAQKLTAYDTQALTPERLAEELKQYIADFGEDEGAAIFAQEYECSFDAALLGAVLGRSVEAAEKDGRISDVVEYDPGGSAIEVSSDIGFRDTAAWWFWQPVIGGFNLIDFDAASGLDADEWCQRLQAKGYKIGRVWLPHDAKAKTFQSKHTAVERFLTAFGAEHVGVVPQSTKLDRIAAARRVIRRCAFNLTACERGLDALRSWQYEWNEETRTFSKEPKHDWASHPGDSYSYGCQVLEERLPEEKAKTIDWANLPVETIDEMLRYHKRLRGRRQRI